MSGDGAGGIARAGLGSTLFFLAAPCVVAGVLPWWLTGWRRGWPDGAGWTVPVAVAGVLGGALVLAGTAVLVHAFVRFVREGRGTPAPVAPTERLVVGGLYRYVRNPMYVAVLAAIAGQALLLGRWVLVAYGAVVAAAFVAFVRGYEQPTLLRRYGPEYAAYLREVPGWWPRIPPRRGTRGRDRA